MGNNTSYISEAEIITEAQIFRKNANSAGNPTTSTTASIFAAHSSDLNSKDQGCDNHDVLPSSDRVLRHDVEPYQRSKSETTVDAVRVAALSSFAKFNEIQGPKSYKKYDPRCYNVKRKLFSWREEKKSPEPMVTIGMTMKLDHQHIVIIYAPKMQPQQNLDMMDNKGLSTYHSVDLESSEPRESALISGHENKDQKLKLLLKTPDDMRQEMSLKSKGRKNCYVGPNIVCGIQLFVTRYSQSSTNTLRKECSPGNQSGLFPNKLEAGYRRIADLDGLKEIHILKPTTIDDDDEKYDELVSVVKGKVTKLLVKDKRRQEHLTKPEQRPSSQQNGIQKIYDLSGSLGNISTVYSAIVPFGIGRQIFTPERLMNTLIDPVDELICLDPENHVYVCDIGLSPTQCDFIVDTTERCSRGNYSAYTYAKQTLGCRDNDELAVLCEWPVMRAYSSIVAHLERRINMQERGGSSTLRQLVLDEREPHVVKYDTSKKERQKLDTHTDKSEWTFIVALSDGNGKDYDGGGTYIESIDATIHLQKGQALIFPGKQRHRGQKIIKGIRFLLVGFLIEKDELDGKDAEKKKDSPHV